MQVSDDSDCPKMKTQALHRIQTRLLSLWQRWLGFSQRSMQVLITDAGLPNICEIEPRISLQSSGTHLFSLRYHLFQVLGLFLTSQEHRLDLKLSNVSIRPATRSRKGLALTCFKRSVL